MLIKMEKMFIAAAIFAMIFTSFSCTTGIGEEYTITYVLNGGTNNAGNPEKYTTRDLPLTLKAPTREGYGFMGWYEAEDFSGEVITEIAKRTTGNKTFYAKWAEGMTMDEVESATFSGNQTIKIAGPITDDTISTLKEKIKNLPEIALDLSETTGLTSIGDEAFSSCYDLTSILIPNSVTSIGKNAFRGCSNLTSITIPNSITSIGDGAFFYCIKLTSITIPNSVTSIGENAFMDCGLTNVEIPSSVTSIGMCAFAHCMALTSVKLPDNATSIAPCMFQHCAALTNVEIPSSVTSIRECAFENCMALTSITIPNNVTSIGHNAFNGCTALTSVTFEDTTGWWYAVYYPDSDLIASDPTDITEDEIETLKTDPTKLIDSDSDWAWNFLFKGERG